MKNLIHITHAFEDQKGAAFKQRFIPFADNMAIAAIYCTLLFGKNLTIKL